jgi:hypothetical protein
VKKIRAGSALPAMALLAVVLAAATYLALAPAGAVAPASASTPTLAASPTTSASPSSTPSSTPTASPTATPTATPTPAPNPPPPLTIVSVTPRAKARNVPFARSIRIRFSTPLAADTPFPKLTPKVPGAWKIVGGSTLEFAPKGHLPVYTKMHLTVPGGTGGVRAADGAHLKRARALSFTVGGPSSVLRLQQLLAELGYLPLRFVLPVARQVPGSVAKKTVYVSAISREPRSLDLISLTPRSGVFAWRYHHRIPRSLAALWQRRKNTVLIEGAVMAFESDHKLAADGVAGRKVWTALLRATCRHLVSRRAYRSTSRCRHRSPRRCGSGRTAASSTTVRPTPASPSGPPRWARSRSTRASFRRR